MATSSMNYNKALEAFESKTQDSEHRAKIGEPLKLAICKDLGLEDNGEAIRGFVGNLSWFTRRKKIGAHTAKALEELIPQLKD